MWQVPKMSKKGPKDTGCGKSRVELGCPLEPKAHMTSNLWTANRAKSVKVG